MANFCVGCGSPVNPQARFCVKCGAALSPSAAPEPTPQAAPTAPKPRGSLFKFLLIVATVFVVFGAIGIASLVYVGYRVKNKVEQVAQQNGIDLNAPKKASMRRMDPCALLTKEEAGDVLGTVIERTEMQDEKTCNYFAAAPTASDRDQQAARFKELMDSKSTGNNPQEDMKRLEGLTKTLIGGATGAGQFFSVSVEWEDGSVMMTGMKLGMAGLEPGIKTTEDLTGIGDRAVLGPMASVLIFTKGATGVQLDLRMVPDGREKGSALAKIIASRLNP